MPSSSRAAYRLVTLLVAWSLCRIASAADPWRNETFELAPKSGGAPYVIQISVPDESFPGGPAPEAGFPVIYVLDGSYAFATLADISHLQGLPFGPSVVVGIRYPDAFEVDRRGFDLTPPPDPSWAQRAKPGDVGGADAFLAFIEGTLKPAIAQRVKIDSRKQALFGHSYGGLFVLHVLLTKPDAFDTYVAASATVGYGEGQLSKQVEAARSRTYRNLPRRLLMTVGGLEASVDPQTLRFAKKYGIPPPPPVEPGKDTVTLQLNFAKSLQGIEGLDTAFVKFDEETHNSSIPAYLARGARWTMLGWDQL